jgi:LuxR family quorum-sensing transcriptional regulator LasR
MKRGCKFLENESFNMHIREGALHMKSIESFSSLMCSNSQEAWSDMLFSIASGLGYERTLVAILPDRHTPPEAEYAFLQSNYPACWRNRYDAGKLGYIDPIVSHCAGTVIPLIWSPEVFSARPQKEMYEEACSYGIRSGVTLPIHGANGELGILCFVTDNKPDKHFQREAQRRLPELSYLRDFVFETSLQFMKNRKELECNPSITPRELECITLSATGKSSWEIGKILRLSEATVNFHFSNLRRKFNTTSRQQAIIKAFRLGLIRMR